MRNGNDHRLSLSAVKQCLCGSVNRNTGKILLSPFPPFGSDIGNCNKLHLRAMIFGKVDGMSRSHISYADYPGLYFSHVSISLSISARDSFFSVRRTDPRRSRCPVRQEDARSRHPTRQQAPNRNLYFRTRPPPCAVPSRSLQGPSGECTAPFRKASSATHRANRRRPEPSRYQA